MLGVGDIEMSKTERLLLSRNLPGRKIIKHVVIIGILLGDVGPGCRKAFPGGVMAKVKAEE